MKFLSFFMLFFALSAKAENIQLEKTDIGQAVQQENISEYRKALKNLEKGDQKMALKVLKAEDQSGNNLLHLMTQVKNSREQFAGEILRLSIIFMQLNDFSKIDQVNNENLTAKQTAKKADNSLAFEYLNEAENAIKLIGNDDIQLKNKKLKNLTELFYKENIKKGLLGGMLLFPGSLFTLGGLSSGSLELFLFGLPQFLLGGGACYEVFKTISQNRKN